MPRLNFISAMQIIIEHNADAIDIAVNLLKQHINDNGANLSSDDKARIGDIITRLTRVHNAIAYQTKDINNILSLIAPRIAKRTEEQIIFDDIPPMISEEINETLDPNPTPDDILFKK